MSSVRAGVRPIHRPQPQVQSAPERDRLRPDRRRDPAYTLALHWAYLTCPDVNQPELQRSAAILCRLRELRGERDPIYRHYADKVAAGEVLVPNGKLRFED